jgi:SulP family sulfate permease
VCVADEPVAPFVWIVAYRGWLRWDLRAGLTAAAVVIPQAMAHASIANRPA